jgi:hypothetical protein
MALLKNDDLRAAFKRLERVYQAKEITANALHQLRANPATSLWRHNLFTIRLMVRNKPVQNRIAKGATS